MSRPEPAEPEARGEYAPSVAARLALYQRAGGIVTPLLTAFVAFLAAALVVLATTGKNPLRTYGEIFDGTGLNWLGQLVKYVALTIAFQNPAFPSETEAALNLQQTLIAVVPLVLTGLAVAFAFRCGLFNIGGQGQYTAGAVVGVVVGSSFVSLHPVPHIVLTVLLAALAGAAWAGLAGVLKAATGAHEVITTIMLNWIALWTATYFFQIGGPLQDPAESATPVSKAVAAGARLPVFWGDPELQGLHIGFFAALTALVVFWAVLNRTTLGYEIRTVGFNPEAARYGGISVGRSYVVAMAVSGAFAGLAGALDILGWQFRLDQTSVRTSQIGFIGIAVALLGRNTAVGVFLSAVLFGALLNGTSTRNIDPDVFRPELAGNLTLIIQGLVVLFVGADLLILYLWQLRRKLRTARAARS